MPLIINNSNKINKALNKIDLSCHAIFDNSVEENNPRNRYKGIPLYFVPPLLFSRYVRTEREERRHEGKFYALNFIYFWFQK